MNAIWLTVKAQIEEKVISNINAKITNECFTQEPKIKDQIQVKIRQELRDIILNIFQLKVYEIILDLQQFRDEDILPAGNTHASDEEIKIRQGYQSIKNYMRNRMVFEASDEYEKFFSSQEYKDFKKQYFEIKGTELINIVATDALQRIKNMGILIRFGSVLPFDDKSRTSAVQ